MPPSDEEVAAIVAAVEATRPVAAEATRGPERPPTPLWRFSARWWRKPVASRRDRPR